MLRGEHGSSSFSFDPRLCREIAMAAKAVRYLGPAVRISRIIQRVDANEYVLRCDRFRVRERVGKEYGVSRRNVGVGMDPSAPSPPMARFFGTACPTSANWPEYGRVNRHDKVVLDRKEPRHTLRGFQFNAVTLAVGKAQGEKLESLLAGDGAAGRRIESAGNKNNGVSFHVNALVRHRPR